MLAIPLLLAARAASAEEGSDVTWRVGPYVKARAADTGETIDVGVEAYPSAVSSIGGLLYASVQKADTNDAFAEVSSEGFNFGLSLGLFTEFGRGAPLGKPASAAPDTSVFGVGLDASWSLAKYDYRPRRSLDQSVVEHSWLVSLRGWWFTTLGAPKAVPESLPGDSVSGERPPPAPTSYSAWLAQPQLQLSYGRRARGADDSYVVSKPDEHGLQLVERVKLTPPVIVPVASVLLAVPIAPPATRFAFAPALRLSMRGATGEWEPLSEVARARLELWLYYFAFDAGPAVRVGVAPYVSARLYGTEARDEVTGGGVIELRESTSRLSY